MNAAQLRSRFERFVRPRLDKLIVAQDRPVLVMAGGQPGAGKTKMMAAAQWETPAAVKVDGDDLRKFHPAYDRVMATDPLRMPLVTAEASSAWVRMSLEYLRRARASVLMETTMRQPDAVFDTLQTFRDAGYGVEVRVIAVPETLSRLGTLQRYVGQVESQGAGRWAPSNVHNEAYTRMPESLERVVEAGLVDRVIVQKRDDVTILSAAVVPGDERGSAVAALAAVEAGRGIDGMTPNQAQGWLSSMEHTARFVADAGVSDPDILNTVAVLRDDILAVAAAAQPFDVDRRALAAARVQGAVDRAVRSG